MDEDSALHEIQRMHEAKTVRRESIIGWYYWYADKLPRMHPERSVVDLVRTGALWMELTDRGGKPGFPYEYRSELDLSVMESPLPTKPSWAYRVGLLLILAGLIGLFVRPLAAAGLIVLGPVVWWVGYQLSGGPTNPDLLKEGSTLYRKEGRRVLEWHRRQRHRIAGDGESVEH